MEHGTRRRTFLILAALWLLGFCVSTQTMMVAPILPSIASQLEIPEDRLGFLVTGYAAAVASVAVLAGPISDRIGRRAMLLAGSALMTVGLALHALANGYASLLWVRILTGASGGVLTGATVAYVGDYFPSSKRGWANGWIASAPAVGQIFGIPLGTVLASNSGFQAPFVVLAAAMGAAFALIAVCLPQPWVRRLEEVGPRRLLGHYTQLFAEPRVIAAILLYLLMSFSTTLYVLYLPTWLARFQGAHPQQIATLFALGGVATVIAGVCAGVLSDRTGRRQLILGSSGGISAAMFATTWMMTNISVAYLLFSFLMGLFAARTIPLQALLAEIVHDSERGSLMSLSMASSQIGAGLGAAVAGPAYGSLGYESNTVIAALSGLLIVYMVWGFLPEPSASTARE